MQAMLISPSLVDQTSDQINLSRRTEFTGFSLVENSMARSPRNDEEWLALSAAFPGAMAIGIQVNAISEIHNTARKALAIVRRRLACFRYD